MFLQIGLTVILLLNAYTYLRIRALFWNPRQRLLFTIGFPILVFSFLIIEGLAHTGVPPWFTTILLAGYLTLPYLLYLFLSVLLVDVLRGINKLVRAVPRDTLDGKTARIATLAFVFIIPALVVLSGASHNSTIRVAPYDVQIPRKAAHQDRLKIAVASDFHLRESTNPHLMPDFVDMVNALDADLLLIPGDIVEGDRSEEQLEQFSREFRRIRTTRGVYATLGNHESHRRAATHLDFFARSSIGILQDSGVVIEGMCTLIGRKDSGNQQRKSIKDLMNGSADSLPVIVMDHKPTDLRNISDSGADITVSGHTHNGQLWPINYITNQIYDLGWGYRKINQTHAFVTSGVQVWGPPVRTAGNSEIMVITASFE